MNGKPKWTPGPWVKDYGDTYGHVKSVPTGHKSGDSTPTVARWDIGAGPHRIRSEQEQAANAHLIAVAPELYEKLERLLSYQSVRNAIESDDLDDALALLAKARGEQS